MSHAQLAYSSSAELWPVSPKLIGHYLVLGRGLKVKHVGYNRRDLPRALATRNNRPLERGVTNTMTLIRGNVRHLFGTVNNNKLIRSMTRRRHHARRLDRKINLVLSNGVKHEPVSEFMSPEPVNPRTNKKRRTSTTNRRHHHVKRGVTGRITNSSNVRLLKPTGRLRHHIICV